MSKREVQLGINWGLVGMATTLVIFWTIIIELVRTIT